LVLIDGGVQAARLQKKKCRSLAYENDASAFFEELFGRRAVCIPTSRLHSSD
jgi:hypothetical protein